MINAGRRTQEMVQATLRNLCVPLGQHLSIVGLRPIKQPSALRLFWRRSNRWLAAHHLFPLTTYQSMVHWLRIGRWLAKHHMERTGPLFPDRVALHEFVAQSGKRDRVLYLEFGVWHGESMRLWSSVLSNPASALHGFDSFEGLPEDWDEVHPAGTFDLGGHIPTFSDPRITLHSGWFSDTLPAFQAPAGFDHTVIHLDADLYSSTKCVLDWLVTQPIFRPGLTLIFDEFMDPAHELRAFDEFLQATGAQFRFVGASSLFLQCAFACVST